MRVMAMAQFYSDLLNWTTAGALGAAVLGAALDLPAARPAAEGAAPALMAGRAASAADAVAAPHVPAARLLPVADELSVAEVTFASTAADAPAGPGGEVIGASAVNLRAGPGTNHPVVDLARRGTRLATTGETSGAWVWVRPAEGAPAWIHGAYFRAE